MSVIDDVRKVIQDLVAPDLKAINARLDGIESTMNVKFDALTAKIDANHQSILYTLNIEKRLEVVERKTM